MTKSERYARITMICTVALLFCTVVIMFGTLATLALLAV
jgi:hypothetical protein